MLKISYAAWHGRRSCICLCVDYCRSYCLNGQSIFPTPHVEPSCIDHNPDRHFLCRDGDLFPSFLDFIKSEGKNNEEQKRLEANLKKLNDFLAKSDGSFFGGTDINALDLQIAPKLKHINIGGKATKVVVTTFKALC